MISLSNSTLNLYCECKRCFWLQFNEKIVRPRGIFSSLPGGIDSVLKKYFNTYRLKGEMPPLVAGKIEGKLADIPLNLSFVDREHDLQITGKLDDCIQVEGRFYVPLDHKTRGKLPDSLEYSQRYYKNQMNTYTLLLKQSGYEVKHIAYIVYYSPNNGELHQGFPFQIAVHRMETDSDFIHRLFIEAKECIEGQIPQPDPECEYCRWLSQATKF